ncbi:MAG: DUF2163 domain-containing protein [Alphaproteobacteria bacterium]|nr:DUF2163 domain-containing protein [Alphaproteobacteria bacterium]
MKSTSSALESHLANEITTLATCWKLTRRDETMQGFTDHDVDLTVGGVVYLAQTGFTPTAISASSNLNVDNLDVQGMLDASTIEERDVMAGIYDFAEIEIFQVNYQAPESGKLILRRGWLGEISIKNKQFVAEVRGLTQKFSQQLGKLYAPACRAELGDAQCGVDMAAYTVMGTIDDVTSNAVFLDNARNENNGYFRAGKITFTDGENAGLSMEVKAFDQSTFTLALPMPYDIAIGDSYTLQAGCDKSFDTCIARFNNAINFRGEPHVPGFDRMLETAATRSEWE